VSLQYKASPLSQVVGVCLWGDAIEEKEATAKNSRTGLVPSQ